MDNNPYGDNENVKLKSDYFRIEIYLKFKSI